jgi:alkanesulfonate monooxygenase SsuD/methylene tetrahydromethanopterin reductase-like flavin-dependent oxidoreductase (luciferase family)
MKLFRCGVNVGRATSRAEWAEKARKCEDLGYSVLTVPDHLTDLLAPLPALVSPAEATTRLRVGTNVLNNDLRHPVLVAREAATVDLLTDGRFQLGLGAGHMQSEYNQAGLGFDAAGTRVGSAWEAYRTPRSEWWTTLDRTPRAARAVRHAASASSASREGFTAQSRL